MRLLSLEINKIFSIGHIELNLDKRGLVLVAGYSHDERNSNAVGKSSLINKSLIWGLYNKTPSGDQGDKVVNIHTDGKNAFVKVKFEGIDGGIYNLIRGRNPNSLLLEKNGTPIESRHSADTQELIVQALGKDYKTFVQTDFFGQGRSQSFFSLTPSEQKAIIEEILPFEMLDQWLENTKSRIKDLDQEILETTTETTIIESQLVTLEHTRSDLTRRSALWNTKHYQDTNLLKERINNISTHNQNIKNEISNLENKLKGYEKAKELISIGSALRGEIDELNRQMRIYEKEHCPACRTKISPEIRDEKLKILSEAVQQKSKEIGEKEQEWEIYKEFKFKLPGQEIEKIQAKIETLKEERKDISYFTSRLEEIEKEKNPFEDSIIGLVDSISAKEQIKLKLTDKRSSLTSTLNAVKVWESGFSKDLKNYLFEKACPYLSDRTNSYLRELGNPQLRVQFSTTKILTSGEKRNDLAIRVSSDTGGSHHSLLSGGEQGLLGFAIGLALSDLAQSQGQAYSNILVLDEPFTYLAKENAEKVVTFLTTKLSKRKESIFLISNDEDLKNLVPNIIRVEKRNGITSVV